MEVIYSEKFEDEGKYSFDSKFIEGSFTNPTGHSGNIHFNTSKEHHQDWSVKYRTSFQKSDLPMILIMDSFNRSPEGVHYLEWIEIEK
ncbi:hypothetical protein [Carboxylicivirga sp. N1Y90]|uniref:hypothetical protein n=1 Tax=Carboxylicivirga fragile TaxID=3417571 RepID=UPI003D352FF2|nr:hypothetical protein [Marinilabiliaceae bacterium N1Y90]